jgi:hypothetical protein
VITILLAVQAAELAWLGVLTAAWVVQHRRHDRLMSRVGSLSQSVTKVSRMRHTGAQSAVNAQTGRPKHPPFPVAPPSTNPLGSTGGRHARP